MSVIAFCSAQTAQSLFLFQVVSSKSKTHNSQTCAEDDWHWGNKPKRAVFDLLSSQAVYLVFEVFEVFDHFFTLKAKSLVPLSNTTGKSNKRLWVIWGVR